ncbi:hypothetical protein ABID14_000218 [Peptoniphilus olsenii]|uniref:Uncharacterized protein n=1 Tax=Peptoniphilus olsenii TaxID=411570 RepID=A0ABV2J778_9FIRM
MFEDLVPMDCFFESIYASQILETLKDAGFDDIDSSIKFIAVKEVMRLKNFCNTDFVPIRLYYLLYEMILGSFLERMFQSGKLPESFDFDSLGGRITLGDTSVELSDNSNINDMSEKKLMIWISSLKSNWQKEAITCRKLEW